MKKLILLLLITLSASNLIGCGKIQKTMSSISGDGTEICQGGVLYLQFTSGVSVAYNPNGTIKTCK